MRGCSTATVYCCTGNRASWSEHTSLCRTGKGFCWSWLLVVLTGNFCRKRSTNISSLSLEQTIHVYVHIPRWELALTEVSDTSQVLCISGQQYFTSISSANRFSPTLGAFKASTRHLQEREGLFLIQKSSVSHSGSIESRDMFLRLGTGTSNCTPILYHLSLTECNALMAAFNVSAVPVENSVVMYVYSMQSYVYNYTFHNSNSGPRSFCTTLNYRCPWLTSANLFIGTSLLRIAIA